MSFSDSILARTLRKLAEVVCKYPKWLIYPQIVLSLLCVVYTIQGLKLDMNRDNLIGPGVRYHEIYLNFRKEFPGEDQLVLVEGDRWEQNRQFMERLATRIKSETNLFTAVFYKGDLATLGPKALLLAPTSDLEQMRKSISEYRPFLQNFAQATNLESLFSMVDQQFLSGGGETPGQRDALLNALPFIESVLVEANQSLSGPGHPPPPGIESLFGGGTKAEQQLYLTFDKGRIFMLTFQPNRGAPAARVIERLRELLRETENEVPGVNAGLTGSLVLNYDEMRQSERDSIVAGVAALIICSLIFIVAYRGVGRPLMAAFCLLIGFGYTLGYTTLTVGHLNILTITFAPMLIGLGIDFGVQFITRYEEELRNQRPVVEAISKATIFTGQGIVIGGVTTAVAFLAMALTNFRGIREMGIICGGGLLLCLIPMMTTLPALLVVRGRQSVAREEAGVAAQVRLRIEKSWLQYSAVIVLVVFLLCTAAALQIQNVYFDYNLLHMQSKNLPSVVYEGKLLQSAGRSVMFAAVVADSPQQARQYEERIKTLPSVSGVDSAAGYLTAEQGRKLELIRAIKSDLADIHFAPIDKRPVQIERLSATLWYLTGYLGLALEHVKKENPDLARQLSSLRMRIQEFRKTMLSGQPQIEERLSQYQQALFHEFHNTIETLKTQDASGPLRAADLPPVLRDRFVGVTGKYLLQVYPNKDIWQHENQREFIRELESVVPPEKVTGQPTQIFKYTSLLKASYQQAAWYSLAAITIMLIIHFRSLGSVLLALLPVGIGFVWLLGFMGATGIPFNPANIMTLPLVVGIGVTNGIQILNRVAEEREPGVFAKSTGKAVLVSGLTAITGFGTLLLAKHQGIKSLGEVMPLGIAACMIVGLTFLPALLSILARLGWTMKSDQQREPEAHLGWHWLRWRRH